MSEALQQLIQQAEEHKLEMEMQFLYAKNMALFKQRFPNIHKTFLNHKPSKVILKLDPGRNINLVDVEKRMWFYHDSPISICNQQVKDFTHEAKVRKFHVVKSKEQNSRHLHIQGLNRLLDKYDSKKIKKIIHTPKLITNLLVTGVGLGYHLAKLIQGFDIKNILIHENCKDTFFASLHTLDWRPILDYFAQNGRSIIFCIGVSPERVLEQIEAAVHNVGLHSQIFTFAFKHSTRKCEGDFLNLYVNEIRTFIGGLGYFDDERIGLAHAYHNINSEHSVFVSRKRKSRNTRLLIVGNGPSLDMHKQYLQRNKGKAIIFSCGTALASLIRMGIKPDFHIEMERPSYIEDVINIGTTQQQRQGITLLCLHTVSPQTLNCFDEVCYAIKPNDAGSSLVHNHFKPEIIPELAFSNPTVTNCALAFAASMGFLDVHLIGVDLGIKEEGRHHAKNSIYYDYENLAKRQNTNYKPKYSSSTKTREGNFGGLVKTPPVLDMARSAMERLLKIIVVTFPEFRCINSNDGVKIDHTIPLSLENIEDCSDYDKTAEIQDIKATNFLGNNSIKTNNAVDYLAHLHTVHEKIKLDVNIANEDELYTSASNIIQQIKRANDPLTHFLLRGTANCYLGAIIENCLYCASNLDFKERVKIGIAEYNNLIDDIFNVLKNDPYEIDDTVVSGFKSMRAETQAGKQLF